MNGSHQKRFCMAAHYNIARAQLTHRLALWENPPLLGG